MKKYIKYFILLMILISILPIFIGINATYGVLLILIILFIIYVRKPTRISFGKYKGYLWKDVPLAYLEWVTQNLTGTNKNIALQEIEKRATQVAKKQSTIIYDQDGNISTDEVMNEQLRQAIKNYDNNVISNEPYQEHLEKIKQSKDTTIFSPEGIYFEGEFISNEELDEQEEREKFLKEQEELFDLEHEQILEEIQEYEKKLKL